MRAGAIICPDVYSYTHEYLDPNGDIHLDHNPDVYGYEYTYSDLHKYGDPDFHRDTDTHSGGWN
jgi:hypothetical protein